MIKKHQTIIKKRTLPPVLFCQCLWEASLALCWQLSAFHTGRPGYGREQLKRLSNNMQTQSVHCKVNAMSQLPSLKVPFKRRDMQNQLHAAWLRSHHQYLSSSCLKGKYSCFYQYVSIFPQRIWCPGHRKTSLELLNDCSNYILELR